MFSILFILLASVLMVCSTGVSIVVPLDNQLPQIARINQEYRWTFSNSSFAAHCGDSLDYTAPSLRPWLTFDAQSRTFHGTPSEDDEGKTDITVTAHGCGSSASSWFDIPVISTPPLTLANPIANQFDATNNTAISSLFRLSPNSAIHVEVPTLRVPDGWSFSLGFDGDTFTGSEGVFYDVLMRDRSPLPDWMGFNHKTITLNGVAPRQNISCLQILELVLIASERKGYTGIFTPFDLAIAAHELSLSAHLPTINVTSGSPFKFSLHSSLDYSGMLIDRKPLEPSQLEKVVIDTTGYHWLQYEETSWTVSGTATRDAASHLPTLPVRISTIFGQSLDTTISLSLVPSYFRADVLDPLVLSEDGDIHYNLTQAFSNATDDRGDVQLTVVYEPAGVGDTINFDSQRAELSGVLKHCPPSGIRATFTAFSEFTHSTSHTTLPIECKPSTDKKEYTHRGQLSPAAHAKLALGLGVTFGILGGFAALGFLLAVLRRCARVEDSAVTGEEGRSGWTEKDRQWYGIDQEKRRQGLDIQQPSPAITATPPRVQRDYGEIGLGLRRIMPHGSSSNLTGSNKVDSPGVMRKKEFVTRIRDTVRNVSDKYAPRFRRPNPGLTRPVIGRPILVNSSREVTPTSENPFADPHPHRSESPTRTTVTHHGTVRFDQKLTRQGSFNSIASNESDRAHAIEAVVQTASRATSLKTARSTSQQSTTSDVPPRVTGPRPRLVPFTSSSRVPIPQSGLVVPNDSRLEPGKRVTSQSALVVKQPEPQPDSSDDDLSMGLHYVQTLGTLDLAPVNTAPSTLTISTNVRSSFSSLESSHNGENDGHDHTVRMLVRTGEQFNFRVSLPNTTASINDQAKRKLYAKQVSGRPLPAFLHADLTSRKHRGTVEFYGLASTRDLGEFDIGVYTEDNTRLARVCLEIVSRQ